MVTMNKLKIFFRPDRGDFVFKSFTSLHKIILLIGLLGAVFIFKNRESLGRTWLKKILLASLLIQQFSLYAWYIFSGSFSLAESLPFYNCRIAILSLALGLILNRKSLKTIGLYWGLMGSVVALLLPDLDPFGYNHYTFYSFFLGHLGLLWTSLYLILVEDMEPSRSSLGFILIFSSIYHILILGFNRYFSTNYCYLVESPIFGASLGKLPANIYAFLIIGLFNLNLVLVHFILVRLRAWAGSPKEQ